MLPPRPCDVPEHDLPRAARAQLRAIRRLLGLPLTPPALPADDHVRAALYAVDFVEKVDQADRVPYDKATRAKLRPLVNTVQRALKLTDALPEFYRMKLDQEKITLRDDLNKHLEILERDLQAKPAKALKYSGARQRAAAYGALTLLARYPDRWRGKPFSTHLASTWCKLAALLYGDPRANLYRAVRETKKKYESVGRL